MVVSKTLILVYACYCFVNECVLFDWSCTVLLHHHSNGGHKLQAVDVVPHSPCTPKRPCASPIETTASASKRMRLGDTGGAVGGASLFASHLTSPAPKVNISVPRTPNDASPVNASLFTSLSSRILAFSVGPSHKTPSLKRCTAKPPSTAPRTLFGNHL